MSTRPIRDCTHPIAQHQHGTNVAYVADRCRCLSCTNAARIYNANLRRQKAYGRSNLVPAGQARLHVLTLGRQGMGWKRVALNAGLSTSIVWKLIYGDPSRGQAPARKIRKETADKILAVSLDLAPGATINGVGTRRRLRALHATGWSQLRIANLLGMQIGNYSKIVHNRQGGGVTHATDQAVRRLYDEIWDQAPVPTNRWERSGITHALTAAKRHGWCPPLAWDDDTIDDPDAGPHGHTPEPDATRNGFGVVNADSLTDLAEWGYTTAQAADRLHVTKTAIEHGITRHAPHLRETYSRNATAQKEHIA